jgi:hypothetical protein
MRELHASSRLAGHLDWPGFARAIRIERTTTTNGEQTNEVSYAVTSLSAQRASAEDLLRFNRGHWGIENRLHWVRDVTFGEDGCRMRTGDGPQNLAALRNAGLFATPGSRCCGFQRLMQLHPPLETTPLDHGICSKNSAACKTI